MISFDRVHPGHRGLNTVHLTRIRIADHIVRAGYHRVLDLPCGNGTLTQMLLDRGVEVVPADLDPSRCKVTSRRCVRADLHAKLPFQDKEFDVMACIEGIEHIQNPHLLASEANRILQKGGCLYISTPNVLSIRSRLSYLLRGYPNQFHYMIDIDPATGQECPIAHINPVGFLEIRYVLSQYGFRVDLIETNHYHKRYSPFYQLLRLLMLTRGRRSAATHPRVSEVRRTLLSDEVLFGDALIVGATKIEDAGMLPTHSRGRPEGDSTTS